MFNFFREKDMLSFVISALINEASKEGKPIYPDYFYDGKFFLDAYLPKRLSVFDKSYRSPFIVEIKDEMNENEHWDLVNKLISDGFHGTLIYVSQKRIIEKKIPNEGFNVALLGKNFINTLVDRNEDVYLNHILGDSATSFSSKKSNDLYIESNLIKKNTKLKSTAKKKVKISENDADALLTINKNEFRAYFNRDSGKNNCAVIIGNGVSIPFGSDNWSAMIKNLVDRLEPFHIEKREHVENALSNSTYALSSFVKNVLVREEDEDKYIDAIRFCIYRKYNELMHDQKSIIKVIAIAKEKYQFLPLFTYNYDTFVEREYWHRTQKNLDYYSNDYPYDNIDEITQDNVIHLHGYISYSENKSKGIVLTDEDYFNAYLNETSWVYKTQVDALRNFTCLFVGSSMSDLFQMSLIQKAKKQDQDGKWNCFALMCLKGLYLKEKMKIMKYYKEKGIQIISADDFDKLPEVLAELLGVENEFKKA